MMHGQANISCYVMFREVIALGFGDRVTHACARFLAPGKVLFVLKMAVPEVTTVLWRFYFTVVVVQDK